MSEQPVQQAPRRAAAGGGSFLTRRSGPFKLPNWEWIGFAIAILIVLFVILRQKKKGASQQQGNAAGVTCPQGYAPDAQGNCVPVATSSNAVPQFVNQTYTTVSAPDQTTVNVPPSAPGTPGPAGPPGPPGPPGPAPPAPPTSPPPKLPTGSGYGVWTGISAPASGSFVFNPNYASGGAATGPRTGAYPVTLWGSTLYPHYPPPLGHPPLVPPVNGGVF